MRKPSNILKKYIFEVQQCHLNLKTVLIEKLGNTLYLWSNRKRSAIKIPTKQQKQELVLINNLFIAFFL